MNYKDRKKWKIKDESLMYMWEIDYFIMNNSDKIVCPFYATKVFEETIIHYTKKKHLSKYEGSARAVVFQDFNKHLKYSTTLFRKFSFKQVDCYVKCFL